VVVHTSLKIEKLAKSMRDLGTEYGCPLSIRKTDEKASSAWSRCIVIIEYSNPIPKLWVLLNNDKVHREKETV